MGFTWRRYTTAKIKTLKIVITFGYKSNREREYFGNRLHVEKMRKTIFIKLLI